MPVKKDYKVFSSKNQEKSFEFPHEWLKKWVFRRAKTMEVAKAYENYGDDHLKTKSKKLKQCGSFMLFDSCPNISEGHTKTLTSGNFCDDRLCSICNKRRAISQISSLIPSIREQLHENSSYKLIFLTLTIKNLSKIDKIVYKNLLKNWRKFQYNFLLGRTTKRKENGEKCNVYNGSCVGGIMTIETTYNNNKQNWHPHIHALLICKDYLNQKKASEYWYKLTGDSFIVSLNKVRPKKNFYKTEVNNKVEYGLIGGVIETVKYLAKLNKDMPGEKIVELAEALKRVRCVNAFGVLKGYMVRAREKRNEALKEKKCTKCGKSLIEIALKWYSNGYYIKNHTEEKEYYSSCDCICS